HGDVGRVELSADELPRALTEQGRRSVIEAVRSAGYATAEIDEQPFRSGSLNAGFAKRLDIVATP
ncbi:MAG: hypothetical protein ACRDNY_09230, partial [Gaiellaceae bacterium]